jgi:3-oxo-5-alpha-steroid 4-dehydrogenase 1
MMTIEPFSGEMAFFQGLVWLWLAFSALSFIALSLLNAPYGRHARKGWGPTVHRTLGWVLMESPAVFLILFFLITSPRGLTPVSLVFAGVWLSHYLNRTFVFPFRLRGGQLRMPLLIAGMAFGFNLLNGYTQGRYLFVLGPERGLEWLYDPRFLIGLAIFFTGSFVNRSSDTILRNLRQPGETGYKIPHQGLFKWVSCPNYLGEMIEWTGWAILTWSISGTLFAVYTAANLVPRARAHHQWYLQRFPTYPAHRKILLPYLY